MRIKLLYLYTIISVTMQSIIRTDLNLFFREIGLTNGDIGNITSAQLWGAACLGLLVSIFADILGRKRMLIASIIFFPLGNLGLLLAGNMNTMLLFSFIQGGFSVVSFTVIQAMLVDITTPKERAKVIGINLGLMMGVGVFGNFFAGVLGTWFGLKNALLFAIIGYLFAIIPVIMIKDDFKGGSIHSVFDFSGFTKEAKILVFLHFMTTLTVGFGAGLFIHFGNLIFKDLFNMTTLGIGIALSIAQVGTAFSNFFTHRLGRVIGPFRFKLITQALVVPLIIAMAFVRQPIVFIIIYAMRFVLMNSGNPIRTTIINSYVPSDKISTIAGLNSLINNSVRAVAALLFGYIVGASVEGYTTLFLISAVFYGINVLIAIVMYRQYENDPKVKELYNHKTA
ncbi:MAG TPA: MFS transporter [Thermotogota bacterium]|nr:MFS transporter [Thermotogota bacterium]HPJ90091.1 MFS transporter [Thermotogota bacterium]HPR97285.1 MFS transporter [Thermotogota bacterium]